MNFLKYLRDVYHRNNTRFEQFVKIIEIVITIVSGLLVFFELKHIWGAEVKDTTYIEICKIGLELLIFFYFGARVCFTFLASVFLDPLKDYFKESRKEIPYSDIEEAKKRFRCSSPINKKEIAHIVSLAENLWGVQYPQFRQREIVYHEWWLCNPAIFSLFYDNDKPIGFLSVVPLANNLHYEFQLDILNIDRHLVRAHEGASDNVYIHGIFLKQGYQKNTALVQLMQETLMKQISFFMKPEDSLIYITARYNSMRKYFGANGFGQFRKKYSLPPYYYLPVKNFAVDPNANRGLKEPWKKGVKSERAEWFTETLKKVHQKPAENGSTNDFLPFCDKPLLGHFMDSNFRVFKTDDRLVNNFLGKSLKLYTHAVYSSPTNPSLREHSLGISLLTFENKAHDNFIACNFRTASRTKNRQYQYQGACFFTVNGSDIVMLFHPMLAQGSDTIWNPYPKTIGESPVIITGRILRNQEGNIVPIAEEDGLLSLHLTTFSQQSKSTVSKIALLSLKNEAGFQPDFQNMFASIELSDSDTPLLRSIKSFLMRSNKVMVKSLTNTIVNDRNHIDNFFKTTYRPLRNNLHDRFELYYFRNQQSVHEIGTAHLRFLDNGLVQLKRKAKQSMHDDKDKEETYYGELNVRHINSGNKLLYIKFVEVIPGAARAGDPGVSQHFRELFCIFFWPAQPFNFDFTRGVLLGDRDVDASNSSTIITSCNAVLCSPNTRWKEHFDKGTQGDNDNSRLHYGPDRLNRIYRDFLSKIYSNSFINVDKAEWVSFDEHKIAQLLNTIELTYDEKNFCMYSKYF